MGKVNKNHLLVPIWCFNELCLLFFNKPPFGTHNGLSLFDGDVHYQLYIINSFPIIFKTMFWQNNQNPHVSWIGHNQIKTCYVN
jgi:hypothetical protein